jgi:hypothetical protein
VRKPGLIAVSREKYRANVDVADPPFDRHLGDPPAMTAQDEADIIAFLKTLTDGYQPDSPCLCDNPAYRQISGGILAATSSAGCRPVGCHPAGRYHLASSRLGRIPSPCRLNLRRNKDHCRHRLALWI